MPYPPLSLIRPPVRRRLRRLVGGDPRAPKLDRARVEAAFGRHLRSLGIERAVEWRDGLGAARAVLMERALAPMGEQLSGMAAAAAARLAREQELRQRTPEREAARRAFCEAAVRAAGQAASEALRGPISGAVCDAVHMARTRRTWAMRWGERAVRGRGMSAVADLYLACRQPRLLDRAITASHGAAREGFVDAPPPPSFEADWTSAWMVAWASLFELASARESPLAEARRAGLEALLEEAGAAAGREVLETARVMAFGTFVESAFDPAYGAWCALSEVNAGSPAGEEGRDWHAVLRGFWLPFVAMSIAGLARYWVTPETIVALPLPALTERDGGLDIAWRDGERARLSLGTSVRTPGFGQAEG